jgi:class 3 adenylate cyclase
MCQAPFGGIGGLVLRPWFGRWERNPALCKACMRTLFDRGPGGAELEISLLFADIRGSTGLAERLGPTAFAKLLQAFYGLATEAIQASDGVVDKFVGDEAIGLFIPGLSGADHAARAVTAGREVLARVGAVEASPDGPIPVGAAAHTGMAFVGSVGPTGDPNDFTALGDSVNTTARLASLAAAGELLVSGRTIRRRPRPGRLDRRLRAGRDRGLPRSSGGATLTRRWFARRRRFARTNGAPGPPPRTAEPPLPHRRDPALSGRGRTTLPG